ncbi:class I SAM-dependent methyltransferase [Croceicoccus sp. Ery5]|uniref:class I SAM-dependent methyltransferase n=1 Tax=Croceicoccus sp. Ery5 TaxID=1703340 RepID=UPI001E48067C|nr:class I SAM-dependent methyltransferase [Croceicoccus sp. Ery5]
MKCVACQSEAFVDRGGYKYIMGDAWVKFAPALRLYECMDCHTTQVDHKALNLDAVIAYYGGSYRGDGHSATSGGGFEKKVKRGVGLLKTGGRYLGKAPREVYEFGAGHLANLEAARRIWPDAVLMCDDADKGAIGSHDFLQYTPLDQLDHKLDLLLMCHVLEHLIDPVAELRKLAQHIAPGGMLVIEVPNKPWPSVNRQKSHDPHITFFTRSSIARMFEQNLSDLFEVKETGTSGEIEATGLKAFLKENLRFAKRRLTKMTNIHVTNPVPPPEWVFETRDDERGATLRLVAKRI